MRAASIEYGGPPPFPDRPDFLNLHAARAMRAELRSPLVSETGAARHSPELTENRYQAGAASYLDVVTVQTIALAASPDAD